MSEVIKNREELLFVSSEILEQVKEDARQSSRHMARLLMHLSHDDLVQEMLIALGRDCVVTPNRSLGRSESLQIIEGELMVILFDDLGNVIEKVEMAGPESGKSFLYRFNITPWHTMVPLSDIVVVHEALQGPFEKSSEPPPDWVPTDTVNMKRFLNEILD